MEEQERIEFDNLYHQQELERKNELVERARRMQYFERDEVKAFHSKLLLFQVLKERDQQLKLKKNRVETLLADDKFIVKAEIERRQEIIQNHEKKLLIKNQALAIAQEQALQISVKNAQKDQELKELQQEKAELWRKDAEFNHQKSLEKIKHSIESKKLAQELISMRDQAEIKRQEMRKEAELKDLESIKWAKKKQDQQDMLKSIEFERKNIANDVREAISERHRKKFQEQERQIELQFENGVQETEQKDKLRLEKQRLAKANLLKEMDTFKQKNNEKKMQLRREEFDEREKARINERQQDLKFKQHKLDVRNKLSLQGRQLQDFHVMQMMAKKSKSEIEKQQTAMYNKNIIDGLIDDEDCLEMYVDYQKDHAEDPRLAKFLKEHDVLKKKVSEVGRHHKSDPARLGFLVKI